MAKIVTLTTDFGNRDPYAAAVKGVLLSACAGVSLVDLSHEIGPRDVIEGAFFLAQAAPWFPAGSVHLAVVDPGVGTARRPIAARAGGHLFVAPDNGLLWLALRRMPLEEVRVIEPARLDRSAPASATFHGRDIFAPAAAALACGRPLGALGPEAGSLVPLGLPEPEPLAAAVRGEIIHVDRFGNLVSNIDEGALGGRECSRVEIGGCSISPLRRVYGDAEPGGLLALWNSAGLLEVAVRDGNAAAVLGAGRGVRITARRS